MRRIRALAACVPVLLGSLASRAHAQEAVTLTGHVSSASTPLRGATVQIPQLDLTTTTDANGRYSFIIPSSRVRGQTVTIVARYLRYRQQSASITLVGGALVQDFELRPTADTPAEAAPRPPVAADTSRRAVPGQPPAVRGEPARVRAAAAGGLRAPVVDSTAFMDLAGSADLGAALAGRLPGVEVRSSSALGGTTALSVRGQRTLVGLTQPLVVVNGIPTNTTNIASTSQRAGLGGFDFGSTISDLNPEDVATVELLRGPGASMRYGGRAANGVLAITTRNGRGLNGFDISASQQFASENALRLPEYQNAYGQGLGGAFAFFNGKGGGINDSVSQSWGPALLGQPILQASLTEAGRAEVRTWVPHPDNVSAYFDRGRTLATNVGVQGASEAGQFRLSLANRDHTGLTPQSSLARRSGTLTAGYRLSGRLELTGDAQFYGIKGKDRPGTGMDESNPVSVFSVMGRQVDVQSLRDHLRDASQAQISWQYVAHNNPYFAALQNDNHDERTRWISGGAATYALTDWLRGTLHAGVDRYTDSRQLTIASGWLGGFPYFAGRGDFSTGGREDDRITATQTNVELWLHGAPRGSGSPLAVTLGAGRRGNDLSTTATGTDRLTNSTPPAPQASAFASHTTFVAGGVDATVLDFATLAVSARQESSALLGGSASQLYPSVLASVDLVRANPSLAGGRLDALTLRGGWSRSGADALPALVQQLGLSSALGAFSVEALAAPEVTSGWEVGAELRAFGGRTRADVAYYAGRSENLLLPSAATFVRSGSVSNKGIEAQVELIPLRLPRLEWRVGLNYAKNTGLVESLGGVASLPLGPSLSGMSVEARTGVAPSALVGLGYLRDAAGQLVLRDGHPLPDSVTGPRVLGTSAPSWIAGLSTGVRVVGVDLSVLFDLRRGGQLFSASNRAGGYSGALAETAFRPDTGLLIKGVDAATGQANAVHVTTEAYYHSLGSIAERWMYDASYVKLREARASVAVPLHAVGLHAQTLRVAVVGRNLALWTDAPNVDPEFVLSTAPSRGLEMGQLPTVRSVGVQLSLTP